MSDHDRYQTDLLRARHGDLPAAAEAYADARIAEAIPKIEMIEVPAPPEPAAATAGLSARESRGRQAELDRYAEVLDGYRLTLDRLAAGDRAGATLRS